MRYMYYIKHILMNKGDNWRLPKGLRIRINFFEGGDVR